MKHSQLIAFVVLALVVMLVVVTIVLCRRYGGIQSASDFLQAMAVYRRSAKQVFVLLSDMELEWWPIEGTLIGILRYGSNFGHLPSIGHIATDDDIDIMVRVRSDHHWERVREELVRRLVGSGDYTWYKFHHAGNPRGVRDKLSCYTCYFLGSYNIHVDIHRYIVDEEGNYAFTNTQTSELTYPFQMWGNRMPYRGVITDADGSFRVARFDDMIVPCPYRAEDVLRSWNCNEYGTGQLRYPVGGVYRYWNGKYGCNANRCHVLSTADKRYLHGIWRELEQHGFESFHESVPAEVVCRKGRRRCYGSRPWWKVNNKREYRVLVRHLLDMGRHPFLWGGNLLGYARQGDLLDNDDDMNIGLFDDELDDQVFALIKKLGYRCKVHETARGNQLTLNKGDRRYDQDIEIDVGIWWRTGGKYYNYLKFTNAGEQYEHEPFDLVFDRTWGVFVPTNYERFLANNYGSGWRTPDPEFNYLRDSPALVRHREIPWGSTDPFPRVREPQVTASGDPSTAALPMPDAGR